MLYLHCRVASPSLDPWYEQYDALFVHKNPNKSTHKSMNYLFKYFLLQSKMIRTKFFWKIALAKHRITMHRKMLLTCTRSYTELWTVKRKIKQPNIVPTKTVWIFESLSGSLSEAILVHCDRLSVASLAFLWQLNRFKWKWVWMFLFFYLFRKSKKPKNVSSNGLCFIFLNLCIAFRL